MEINVGSVSDIVTFCTQRIQARSRGPNVSIAVTQADVDRQSPSVVGSARTMPYHRWRVNFTFHALGATEQYDAVPAQHRYGLIRHWQTGGVAAPQWRGRMLMFYDQSFGFDQRYMRTNPGVWDEKSADASLRKWVAMDEFLRHDRGLDDDVELGLVGIAEYVAAMQAQGAGVMGGYTYDDDLVFTAYKYSADIGDVSVYTTWDQDAPPSAVVYTARNGVKILESAMAGVGGGDEGDERDELESLLSDPEVRDQAREVIENDFRIGGVSSEGYSDEWWEEEINKIIEEGYHDGTFGQDDEIAERYGMDQP